MRGVEEEEETSTVVVVTIMGRIITMAEITTITMTTIMVVITTVVPQWLVSLSLVDIMALHAQMFSNATKMAIVFSSKSVIRPNELYCARPRTV